MKVLIHWTAAHISSHRMFFSFRIFLPVNISRALRASLSFNFQVSFLADTWRLYNVAPTSMHRRCINVMCPQDFCWPFQGSSSVTFLSFFFFLFFFYFIVSSEISVYLVKIKVVSIPRIIPLVTVPIYFFFPCFGGLRFPPLFQKQMLPPPPPPTPTSDFWTPPTFLFPN